jgi:hypothetical protein
MMSGLWVVLGVTLGVSLIWTLAHIAVVLEQHMMIPPPHIRDTELSTAHGVEDNSAQSDVNSGGTVMEHTPRARATEQQSKVFTVVDPSPPRDRANLTRALSQVFIVPGRDGDLEALRFNPSTTYPGPTGATAPPPPSPMGPLSRKPSRLSVGRGPLSLTDRF